MKRWEASWVDGGRERWRRRPSSAIRRCSTRITTGSPSNRRRSAPRPGDSARTGSRRVPTSGTATRPSRWRTTRTSTPPASSRCACRRGMAGTARTSRAYSLMAAEIGRYCGSTALTFNMHVSSCLWTGALADDLPMTRAQRRDHNRRRAIHYARIVGKGSIDHAQPFSEGRRGGGGVPPVRHAGRPGRGRLGNQRQEDLRLARRLGGLLRRSVYREEGEPEPPRHDVFRRPRRRRRGERSRRLGPRSACAGRSRAISCSRTCSCRTTRR